MSATVNVTSYLPSPAPEPAPNPPLYRFIELTAMAGPAWRFNFFFQFCMISFVYFKVGAGKYWKTLFIVAVFGLYAALMENVLVIEYAATKNRHLYVMAILAEIGWIVSEFSTPVLAMFRLEAFLPHRWYMILQAVIFALFLTFAGLRFRIGVMRYNAVQIGSQEIWEAHGPAFAVMAAANFICSAIILTRIVNDIASAKNLRLIQRLHKHLLQSGLFVLLCVDFMGFLLALATFAKDEKFQEFLYVFLNFKAMFPLILTVDALVLRLTGRMDSATAGNGGRNAGPAPKQQRGDQPSGPNTMASKEITSRETA